jgi:ubiquinone/menaquinone biosynthesis C-methylase UbiE
MFDKAYWNERAERHGHTGHAEPFYYCFDQQARLHAINELILLLAEKKETALDFGCGSGDFIDVLNRYFKAVYAYDISDVMVRQVKDRFKEKTVTASDNLDELISQRKFDLLLSVTVLQTFNPQELDQALGVLAEHLSEKGVFIAMEFFTTAALNQQLGETKATGEEWLGLLKKHDLKIVASPGFINPHLAPSKSWNSYNNNLFLKSLKPFKRYAFAQAQFIRSAKKIINRCNDTIPETGSPLHIYIIQKEQACN